MMLTDGVFQSLHFPTLPEEQEVKVGNKSFIMLRGLKFVLIKQLNFQKCYDGHCLKYLTAFILLQ